MAGKHLKRSNRPGPGSTLAVILLGAALGWMLPQPTGPDEPSPDAAAPLPDITLDAMENGSPFPLLALSHPTRPQPLPEQPALPEPEPPQETPEPVCSVKSVTQKGGSSAEGGIRLTNESKYDPDTDALLKKSLPVALEGRGIEVLILHTHGTEAYTPSDGLVYAASEEDRTLDPERSVVRVGSELQAVLEARGIGVVHSTALHDYPAYSGSYDRALDDIEYWVQQYPDIRVVIDLHRDSIVTAAGDKYKTAAVIEGESTAQLMFVAGTDGGGLRHDDWQTNLSLHLQLHDLLNTRYPGLMRPVSIRNARFNQHMTRGSMLLEVGTSGNSLTEALRAVRFFGEALADLLLDT